MYDPLSILIGVGIGLGISLVAKLISCICC